MPQWRVASTSQGKRPGIRGSMAGVNERVVVRANRRVVAVFEAKFHRADAETGLWVRPDQRSNSHSVRRAVQQGAHSECLKGARTRASNAARGAIHFSPGEPTHLSAARDHGRTQFSAGLRPGPAHNPNRLAVGTLKNRPATAPPSSGASLTPTPTGSLTHPLRIA